MTAFVSSVLFVAVTLFMWYAVNVAARVAITCIPGGEQCILQTGIFPSTPRPYLYGKRYLDVLVTLVSLAVGFSIAIRTFFPPDDLDASSK
jgi:ABC-type nitrate/sulfonate/bicarbonate transport system permease component